MIYPGVSPPGAFISLLPLGKRWDLYQNIARRALKMAETRRRPPARTPEDEENYMIRISVEAAEKQILSGKASSQLLTHYLKLAATRDRDKLEKDKLEKEIELLKAKRDAIETAKETEALYREAIKAFSLYAGEGDDDGESDTFY